MARRYGQFDPVTTAVELIGERWALLIVRDLLVGARRYTDLRHGLPGVPTNILSTRLRELQEGGVIRRVPLRNCGLVYELTDSGRRLEPIVLELSRWGAEQMTEPAPGDAVTADAVTIALRAAFLPHGADPVDYELRVGEVVLRVQVGVGLSIWQMAPAASPVGGARAPGEPDVVLVAGPELLRGDEGVVRVARGDAALAERFAQDFAFRRSASPHPRASG